MPRKGRIPAAPECAIIRAVQDHRERVERLAELMEEFKLSEARLQDGDFTVAFRKRLAAPPVAAPGDAAPAAEFDEEEVEEAAAPSAPVGTPVSSPMTGIFYGAPSPTSPPFVKEGDAVNAGQVVGLIEAMKVFNEITSTVNGRVLQVVAESGQLVNPGDPLIYVGQ
jgi:acetyl-CoA carboxylase biotin carboxyl carrier protein